LIGILFDIGKTFINLLKSTIISLVYLPIHTFVYAFSINFTFIQDLSYLTLRGICEELLTIQANLNTIHYIYVKLYVKFTVRSMLHTKR